jgi:hypothetical protein
MASVVIIQPKSKTHMLRTGFSLPTFLNINNKKSFLYICVINIDRKYWNTLGTFIKAKTLYVQINFMLAVSKNVSVCLLRRFW